MTSLECTPYKKIFLNSIGDICCLGFLLPREDFLTYLRKKSALPPRLIITTNMAGHTASLASCLTPSSWTEETGPRVDPCPQLDKWEAFAGELEVCTSEPTHYLRLRICEREWCGSCLCQVYRERERTGQGERELKTENSLSSYNALVSASRLSLRLSCFSSLVSL